MVRFTAARTFRTFVVDQRFHGLADHRFIARHGINQYRIARKK